jgi:hypothetical protein
MRIGAGTDSHRHIHGDTATATMSGDMKPGGYCASSERQQEKGQVKEGIHIVERFGRHPIDGASHNERQIEPS